MDKSKFGAAFAELSAEDLAELAAKVAEIRSEGGATTVAKTVTKPVPKRKVKLPQGWQDFEDVLSAGIDRVLLYGPSGTGKTFGAMTIGATEALRLMCTDDMTTFDIAGGMVPNEAGGMAFQIGTAAEAWQRGVRLCVDEADKATGDVLACLLAFTDSVGSATYRLQNGDVIQPEDGFSVVMTSNCEHPRELPTALRDRFPIAICITEPHPDSLIPMATDLHALAKKLVNESEARRYSLRALYAFDQLRATLGVERAAQLIFATGVREEVITALKIAAPVS